MSPMSYKSRSNFGNVTLGLYSIFVGQPLHIQQLLNDFTKNPANEPRDLCVFMCLGVEYIGCWRSSWELAARGQGLGGRVQTRVGSAKHWDKFYCFCSTSHHGDGGLSTPSLSHWWIWPTRVTDSNRKAKQQRKIQILGAAWIFSR